MYKRQANDTVSKIAQTFKSQDADIVYADGIYVAKEDISQVKRIYPGKTYKKRYLNWGWIPLHTTMYVKKEVFDTHGLYDESYMIASDYDSSLRWFKDDQLQKVYLNERVVKMRLGGKSTTIALQKKKSSEDLLIIKKNNLSGVFTLSLKILRKIPQYLLPKLIN